MYILHFCFSWCLSFMLSVSLLSFLSRLFCLFLLLPFICFIHWWNLSSPLCFLLPFLNVTSRFSFSRFVFSLMLYSVHTYFMFIFFAVSVAANISLLHFPSHFLLRWLQYSSQLQSIKSRENTTEPKSTTKGHIYRVIR